VVMTVWCEADLVLPNVTKICARGANTIGVFGLVTRRLTILYHVSILGLSRPGIAFTNHYHRGEGDGGQGTDLGVDLISQVCHTVNGRRVATWAVW